MVPIKELSEDQIETVKRATEDVLATTGFRVMHSGLRRLARAAGAVVDDASEIVRIPAPLLRELLAQVPPAYSVRGVSGREYTIGSENRYCLSIVTDPWIVDYETQTPRRPCLDDVRKHTIMVERMAPVAAVSRMDYPVTDCADATSSLRALEVHLLHHTKHNHVMATSLESYREWLEIAQILAQGADLAGSKLISTAVAVVSPLTLADFNAEILLSACEHGFTVIPTVCPMAGTTSPYTTASTLLLGNAENVFLAALSQIVRPGQPFLYAFGPSITEMQSGYDMYYTLDKVLWKVASVQLGRSYNMPVAAECGGTMTYRYDVQNGAEGMLFMLSAFASGANVLAGIGSCHNANGMSAEMMIVHAAWMEVARFLGRGIDTDALRLGVDSIDAAGPGGNFLTDELTLMFLQEPEFFTNSLFRYSGDHVGGKSLLERAHEEVVEMVKDFESPVPGQVQEDLRRYFHDRYARMT